MATAIEVIVNAGAGKGEREKARSEVAAAFAACATEAQISLAESGEEVVQFAVRAVNGEAHTIVAAGGDGTVNAVASIVTGSGKKLGVVPLGTLNHFAKDLHLPLGTMEAVRTIVAGHTIDVDVGTVNDRIFLNNSSVGLYPSVVRERERGQRLGHGKWPAFVWGAFTVLRRFPFLVARLTVDGAPYLSRSPFVFVGNNVYEMHGFKLGTRARLDAGVLSLYLTQRRTRLGIVALGFRALVRMLRPGADFVSRTATELTVESRHSHAHVSTDGEVTLVRTPLKYTIRPRALKVIVAADYTESAA